MQGKIIAIISFFVFIFVLTSGLFGGLVDFLVWLVTLNMTQSKVSMAGEIFVKIATWAISYSAVGILFNALGWFNSNAMKIVYLIISTVVSFALCYVVMILETYLLYIVITFSVLLAAIAITIVLIYIKDKRKNKSENKQTGSEG